MKKVLIADDDSAILDALQIVLEDEGYKVIATQDGKNVLQLLAEKPNIILLDIWMSGIDGRNICKELKSSQKTKQIPVILVSANRETETIAKDAGADDFITKPFEITDLLQKIAKLLKP